MADNSWWTSSTQISSIGPEEAGMLDKPSVASVMKTSCLRIEPKADIRLPTMDSCATLELHFKLKEVVLRKIDPIENKPYEFDSTAKEILTAIVHNEEIGGINIVDKVQDPTFRFKAMLDPDPELGSFLSEAIAIVLDRSRFIAAKRSSEKASEKRIAKANDYALKMYQVITDMKAEAGVSTYRATADLLERKKIKNPNGGKAWNASTLHGLQKRWQELGLVPLKP
ncbi:hypothetical protein [uncultured Fibrella sp.]|uniref:hypothetical protein n=1 Tax=uncultured Fibrella sp. TaxID=1284596 RepID=UPI0035CB97FD